MRPEIVPCKPQPRNTPSMAAAVMITGTTIGAIIRLAITRAPGMLPRASPTAAAVPAAVAIRALGIMILALVEMASNQTGRLASLRYHCKDKPGGGNVKNGAELNETMTTMTIGKMRKMMIAKHRNARTHGQTRSAVRALIGLP